MTDLNSTRNSTLAQVLNRLEELESRNLPDIIVPLREITWTSDDLVVVPTLGEALPNPWARQQLCTLLGFRFDRWFEAASPFDRAEEMTRRLRRARDTVRLRLVQDREMPTIRAVVSPGYSPIEDSMIVRLVHSTIQNGDAVARRLAVTERMTAITLCIGKPQSAGGIVGDVWGGISLVNSNVGWTGLSVILSLERLVCSNGMRAPTFRAQLVKVRHRAIAIDDINTQLSKGFKTFPEDLADASRLLRMATLRPIVNVEAEARELLRERAMIRSHHAAVLSAYKREPHQSVFGLSQAITLHAQRTSPEDRVALEELAGSYVLRSAP